MKLSLGFSHMVLVAALCAGLTNCQALTPASGLASAKAACTATDVRASCVLEAAHTELNAIETPFNWATSAAELAIAEDANGDAVAGLALMEAAFDRTAQIEDAKKQNTAMGDIALALSKLSASSQSVALATRIEARLAELEDVDKRADILGKLLTAHAVHGDAEQALARARAMPTESEAQQAYKDRTLREIAAQLAKAGDFDTALSVLPDMQGSFTYYRAVAHTDIAAHAIAAGELTLVPALLEAAEGLSTQQDNGYFSAAILREIAYNQFEMGERDRALAFTERARATSRIANSAQEQSRSMSRIATRLADQGAYSDAVSIIEESITLSEMVERDLFKNFAHYEAAGAAAFAGEFDTARALVAGLPDTPFGSAASLQSAAQRDLAWGLVRHGQTEAGLALANAITSPREKIHALSRIARLLATPDMPALPRYL